MAISGTSSDYPLSSDPPPSANFTWKQYDYNAQQIGVSFEYSFDWVIIPDDGVYENKADKIGVRVSKLMLFSQKEYEKEKGNLDILIRPIRIHIWSNPRNLSLQAYNTSLTYAYPGSGLEVSPRLYSATTAVATVAGRQGYHDLEANCDPTYCDQYVIPYNNKFIEIELLKLGKYDKLSFGYPDNTMRPIYSHILSTLQLY
jgi:hypothetical protein